MKKQNKSLSMLSLILCLVLIAVTACMVSGCSDRQPETATDLAVSQISATTQSELGQGATAFYLDVVDAAGASTRFTVHTDKKTVGEALQEVGLVQGEEGPYGLYIKTVNGITADYDTDQTYWAFYIDGKMAPTGADVTDLVAGTTYMLKIEK